MVKIFVDLGKKYKNLPEYDKNYKLIINLDFIAHIMKNRTLSIIIFAKNNCE